MSLLVRGEGPASVRVTPQSAGWAYVGFEALTLAPGAAASRRLDGVEVCVVPLRGDPIVRADGGEWQLGGRAHPLDGPARCLYVPAGLQLELEAREEACEVAICSAPDGAAALPPHPIEPDSLVVVPRGEGASLRHVRDIAMAPGTAQSLLVTEVHTPAGHWSSFPPHKHDRDEPATETLLEETYYHRLRPSPGFGLQRVYDAEGTLEETVAFGDGDVVLVPRGYHTVSAPPGYDLYYLNVMAGPHREWVVRDDPAHAWLRPRSGGGS